MQETLRDIRSDNFESARDADAVVIFLHGFGSNEQDLSSLAAPLDLSLPWASLRAPLDLPHGGAAWFEIITPGIPDAAPVEAATQAIWTWVDTHVGPKARIIPIGFSQGGLMASQLLRTNPERVLAPTILGGFVLGGAQPADARLRDSRPAAFWGRGAQDQVIAPVAIERTSEFLPEHTSLIQKVYPGLAHSINAAQLQDVRQFILEELATINA